MPNGSIEALAAALVAADAMSELYGILDPRFASTVQLEHVPPSPKDGPIPGGVIAAGALREYEAIQRGVVGAEHHADISVEGDAIRVVGSARGVLDGAAVEVTTTMVFTVEDGEIVGLRAELDEESRPLLFKALAAGGLQMPPTEPTAGVDEPR